MNLSEEKYAQIVDLIYIASVHPKGWQNCCKEISIALDATITQILALDVQQNALSFSVMGGQDDCSDRDVAELEYLQRTVGNDPRWMLGMRSELTGWMQCHHFVGDEFEDLARVNLQILSSFDARYVSAIKLLHDADVIVLFAVMTSEERGYLGEAEIAFLNRLLPHLQRVASLQKQVYQFSAAALIGYTLIDKLPQPVVLLNLTGNVAHTNFAAKQLLEQTSITQIVDGKFVLPEPSMSHYMATCHSLETKYRLGELSVGAKEFDDCTKIVQPNGETLYIFSSVMIPETSMRVFGIRPLIMLTLYHPKFALNIDSQLLSTAFGLTPRECQIALLLMDSPSIKEIAAQINTSAETVKKQVQAVYAKTSTHKQSELVKLLLNLPRQPAQSILESVVLADKN